MIFLCLPIGDADDYYNMLPVRHESGSFPDHLLSAQPLPFCWELLQTRQPYHQDVPEHFQPLDSSILTKGVYNTFKAVIEYLKTFWIWSIIHWLVISNKIWDPNPTQPKDIYPARSLDMLK